MLNNSWRHLVVISGILAILSLGLALYAHWAPLFPYDQRLILWLQSLANPPVTWIMVQISWIFGDWHAMLLVIPAAILVWRFLGRPQGIMILAAGLISLLDAAIKLGINRPRPTPFQVHIIGINHGNGFPSGHTFFATIFLGFLAYLLFTGLKNRHQRILSLIVLIFFALLVGTSRIYLGAHWPSDVLGGFVIGGFFLTLLIMGYKFFFNTERHGNRK